MKNLNGVYGICITFLNFSPFWNLNGQDYFLKVLWLGQFKRIKIYDIAYFLVGSREKIDTKCLIQNCNWSFKLDNFLSVSQIDLVKDFFLSFQLLSSMSFRIRVHSMCLVQGACSQPLLTLLSQGILQLNLTHQHCTIKDH